LGTFFGPAVWFEWGSSESRVYLQARKDESESRIAAEKELLEGNYAFSWGRFWFYSKERNDIDFLKTYFKK
jgi:hypothetical protein